jgi:hypothetical protein
MYRLLLTVVNPNESLGNREYYAKEAENQCQGHRSPTSILMVNIKLLMKIYICLK